MTDQQHNEVGYLLRRRTVLGSLVAGLVPLMALEGCGGEGDAASATSSLAPLDICLPDVSGLGGSGADDFSTAKPLVLALNYAGSSWTPVVTSLPAELAGLALAADRFGAGAVCLRFGAEASSAVVNGVPTDTAANFALSFWHRTTSTTPMRVLSLGTAACSSSLAIDLNNGGAIAVFWNDMSTPLFGTGEAGELVDGAWHHVLLQRRDALVQLFVDGALLAQRDVPGALGGTERLQLGGSAWKGDLDEVGLHSRALDADRIPHLVYSWQLVKPSNSPNSMVAYYPFNGDAVNDNGRGTDGILHNVEPATSRLGAARAAYSFNGIDSFIELNGSLNTFASDFAIAFWLNSTSNIPMVALNVSPGQSAFDFVFNDESAITLMVHGGVPLLLSFGVPGGLTDGTWHFVVAQRRGNALELYVDSILRASAAIDSPVFDGSSYFSFGRSSVAYRLSPAYWKGSLDDIQIYVCSFSGEDIKALEGMNFRPRDGAGMLTFRDRLWLLGGWNPQDMVSTNSQVWSSPDGVDWSLVTTAPWEGRHMAGWLVFNDRLWIIGGDRNRGHYQNDVWMSADGVHWDLITDSPPWAGRAAHQVVAFDGRMWLLGGQRIFEEPGQQMAYNDVYASRDGVNWSMETRHAGWSPRGLIVGSAVHRGRIWIIGGGTYDIRTYKNDVWSSADGIDWELVLDQAPWAPRQYHNVIVFDDKLWVIAGGTVDDMGGTTDVWYSADGVLWTQLTDTPWMARHAASVAARGNTLWIAAGSSSRMYNDIWKLTYTQ